MKLLSIICLWLTLSMCHGYRILGVFPFNGKSHFMMFEHMMKGLARRGHQVDVISTFPLKKPYSNYTDFIVLKPKREFLNNLTYEDTQGMIGGSVSHSVATLAGNTICENLANPDIQNFIHNPPMDPSYDLVIIEV